MITTKICSKCNQTKPISEFHKRKISKDGYNSICIQCKKEYNNLNKDNISKQRKKYRKDNKDKIASYDKKYRNSNKEQLKIYNKNKYDKNKRKIYLLKNKDKILKQRKQYKLKNKDSINDYNKLYENKKYYNNINFKLKKNLRTRILDALKNNYKSKSTLKLLGCSIEYLKEHLQQTALQNGYTDFNINNYSGKEYHIDHIKPCASFDLSITEEQEKCFHYSNLQILTAQENLIKSDNII